MNENYPYHQCPTTRSRPDTPNSLRGIGVWGRPHKFGVELDKVLLEIVSYRGIKDVVNLIV